MMIYANDPIVALDVDGVLGDFESHWTICAREVLGRPIAKVNERHSLGVRYGLTSKEVDAVWRAFHPALFLPGRADPDPSGSSRTSTPPCVGCLRNFGGA